MKAMICLGLVALFLLGAGCTSSVEKEKAVLESPIVVKSKVDDNADFAGYKTWSWVRLQPGAQIDPRLDDPAIRSMIADAVDREMFTRGYQRVELEASPDVILNVHATLTDIDHQYIQEHYNGSYYPEYGVQIGGEKLSDEWTEGTTMIILFDGQTRQAVWGASAKSVAFPDLAPDVRRQRIDKLARLLMESLPARK